MPSKQRNKRSSEDNNENTPKKFRSQDEQSTSRESDTYDVSTSMSCSINSAYVDSSEQELQEALHSTKAGVVERIHMKNFMCHDSLEVDFNSKINFIVGRNGSGKSAILTALVVGLGGKASATNRGSSLKEFIKKDKTTASISVTLINEGFFAFEKELYGRKITVVRTINGSTGQTSYKLKSENGDVISTKKEDLDRVISALNIQVDNPVSVLNQDASRTFLNNSSPHEKFSFFLKATQIDKLYILIDDTKKKKLCTSEIIQTRKETLAIAEKEINDLDRKWNALQSLTELRNKAESLENELYWSVVMKEEKLLHEIRSKLNEHANKLPELQSNIDLEVNAENEADDKLRKLQENISDIQERVKISEKEQVKFKEEARICQERYLLCQRKLRSANDDLNGLNADVETLKQSIERFQVNSNSSQEKRFEIQREMKELEERMTAVQGTLATKKQFYSQLKSNGDKILSERTSLEQERQEYDRKIGQKEYEIKNMKKESHNSLSVFGAWVPRVTSRIEQALKEGLFEKKPRGPLGAYVKLKDASWAPAIENFLSSTLFTYCVHSGNDSRALTKIFNEVLDKNERAPSIITVAFDDKLNDVSRNRVQSNEFSSVLDMLIISDTVVCNTLIDNREIETILLIPTSSQACATLSDKRNVPLNCKRAITKKGDQFYPDPNYRTYAARGNLQAKFLQVSMKDAIRVAEEELKRMIMNKKHTESQLSEVMKRMKENRSELAGVEKLMDDLRNKCLRIKSRINELKNSEEPEPTSISTLTTELNEVMEKRQVLTENISKLQTELGHLKCEVVQSESKLKEARNASRSILEEEHPLSNQVQNIQSKRNEIISRKHYRQAKYTEMCKRVSQIESEYSKQQLVVDKRTSDALQVCQRIETNKSPQEVKKELSDCQNYMAGVEQHSGSIEDIGNALFEKKTKYTEIMSGLKYLDSSLNKLHVMYEDRQKKINSICKLTGLRIQHMFKFVLHQRNYTGNLHIDYNANTLDVEVCPNTRNKTISDTKNLSGGERSYATVAFVMALWDAVDPPFYFLDEFDVFMDIVNRRIIMDQLLVHAKQKPYFQFAFFTPLDTPNLKSDPDVTIHRLADPRNDGGTN